MKSLMVYDIESDIAETYCEALDINEAELIEVLFEMVSIDEIKDYLGMS